MDAGRAAGVEARLLDALDFVHDVDAVADFGPALMATVGGLIDCDHFSYYEIDAAADGVVSLLSDPAAEQTVDRIQPDLVACIGECPLLRHYRRQPDDEPRRMSDVIERGDYRRLRVYTSVLRPLRIEHQLVLNVTGRWPASVGVAFNRQGSDFEDCDRLLLARFQLHVRRAYRHCRQRHLLRALLAGSDEPALLEHLQQIGLTHREAEIALILCQGKSNAEIGLILGVSALTVKKHLENVRLKLNTTGRAATMRQILAGLLAA